MQCYGPQASEFANRTLLGRRVHLEFDSSQGRTDRYGRTLAYLWVSQPGRQRWLYNDRAVRRGFATEYTYDTPYHWQDRFVRAEQLARNQDRGLWAACR